MEDDGERVTKKSASNQLILWKTTEKEAQEEECIHHQLILWMTTEKEAQEEECIHHQIGAEREREHGIHEHRGYAIPKGPRLIWTGTSGKAGEQAAARAC